MSETYIDRMIDEDLRDPEFRAAYEGELAAEEQARAEAEALMRRLVRIRHRNRLTQRVVAQRLQVSQARVAQIEKLRHGLSAPMLIRYARAVGAEIEVAVSSADDRRKRVR